MLSTRDERQAGAPGWLRVTGGVLALALLAGGLGWLIHTLVSAPATGPKRAQQITLIQTPPPPPPKPPEKPPEPPKVREEVKLDTPQPPQPQQQQAAAEPPPGPLGLDATGTGAGDGFGLAARPGGRDIIASPSRGGGGFGLFTSSTARHLAQELARVARLRGVEYRVDLVVWLGKEGQVERVEVARGTGNPELDRLIREGLAQVAPLRTPVPEGLPQPLRIRVTSTDA